METLSPELKLEILPYLDFTSLKALVRASPSFHATYRRSRLKYLTSVTLRHPETIGFKVAAPPVLQDFGNMPSSNILVCVPRHQALHRRFEKVLTTLFISIVPKNIYQSPMILYKKQSCTLYATRHIAWYYPGADWQNLDSHSEDWWAPDLTVHNFRHHLLHLVHPIYLYGRAQLAFTVPRRVRTIG